MQPEGSVPCSQETATCPLSLAPEPDQSGPWPPPNLFLAALQNAEDLDILWVCHFDCTWNRCGLLIWRKNVYLQFTQYVTVQGWAL
jgi:hypothetical protein